MAVVMIFASSCESFLDEKPRSFISEENFFQSITDVELAIFGAYEGLQQVVDEQYILAEMRSDNTWTFLSEGAFGQVSRFNDGPDNGIVTAFWEDSYIAIQRCNVILENLDILNDNPDLKSRFEGEARFIRAFCYFNMVRFFGDIPLVLNSITPEDVEEFGKDSAAEVYAAIINDFTIAAAGLPANSTGEGVDGRVTSEAAKAFLAQVHLTLGTTEDLALARGFVEDVINNGGYELEDNYGEIFLEGNEMNGEIIFAVRYSNALEEASQVFSFNFTAPGQSQGLNAPAQVFRDKFSADPRYNSMVSAPDAIGRHYCIKYLDNTEISGIDWPVLRLADVILMYAEILNETGSTPAAVIELNKIRDRAGATLITETDQLAVRDIIMDERQVELAFENYRWYDLLRYERAGYITDLVDFMNNAMALNEDEPLGTFFMSEHQRVYPIPQEQIDLSLGALKQTTGY